MKHKLLFFGLFFVSIGVAFAVLENTFYQYVDENDMLHESAFMPLGVFFVIIGLLMLLVFFAVKLAVLIKARFYKAP
ncbi:MAG: DUF3955 domain-containing protein [Spongiibacteraceae bacterium]